MLRLSYISPVIQVNDYSSNENLKYDYYYYCCQNVQILSMWKYFEILSIYIINKFHNIMKCNIEMLITSLAVTASWLFLLLCFNRDSRYVYQATIDAFVRT